VILSIAAAALLASALSQAGAASPSKGRPDPTVSAQSANKTSSWASVMGGPLESRCRTAICWGEGGHKWGIEPLAELPLGKSFGVGRSSTLASYLSTHKVSASLSAGIRVWGWHDFVSLGLYLSAPLFESDEKIRIRGSNYEHPTSRIKSPLPGLAVGLFGDTLWIGFEYLQLRNGGSDDAERDFNYRRNSIVSEALSITIALSTVTAIRNGLGAATASKK
jgi:hypothetical protein